MFTIWWSLKKLFGKLQPFEERIVGNWFGLTDPRMIPHWERVKNIPRNPRDIFHATINVVVEWVRLHPQRGTKIGILDQAFVWIVYTNWDSVVSAAEHLKTLVM